MSCPCCSYRARRFLPRIIWTTASVPRSLAETGSHRTQRWSGMDSNVQFRANRHSSWFRPSWADLPAHGHPSSCRPRRTDRVVGRGTERRHSPPGSGGVTPRSRCRRCERVAEPKVRIRSPSSGESVSHIDQAGAGRELRLSRGCAPLGWRRGRQRRRPAPGVQSTRGGDGHDPGLLLRRKVTSR